MNRAINRKSFNLNPLEFILLTGETKWIVNLKFQGSTVVHLTNIPNGTFIKANGKRIRPQWPFRVD